MANVKLFNKVKERILTQPHTFAMEHWCNSTACIAGTAVIASIGSKKAHALLEKSTAEFTKLAAKLLDLDPIEEQQLFYIDSWPSKFENPYMTLLREIDQAEAESSPDRVAFLQERAAQVAVDRINHFLKTKE